MRIKLIAVGTRMPDWVETAVSDYARRLPREWRFEVVEIPLARRGKNADTVRARQIEGERQLKAVPAGARMIALDERGQMPDSSGWARALERWQQDGRNVCLLIGGPDGLAPDCLARTDQTWSLSKMTLPHGLVRVMVLEQLYRAWSMNSGHPYHRP